MELEKPKELFFHALNADHQIYKVEIWTTKVSNSSDRNGLLPEGFWNITIGKETEIGKVLKIMKIDRGITNMDERRRKKIYKKFSDRK